MFDSLVVEQSMVEMKLEKYSRKSEIREERVT
jgi:hypothetical protein